MLQDISEYTHEKAHKNEEKSLKIPSYLQEILPILFLGVSWDNTQGYVV